LFDEALTLQGAVLALEVAQLPEAGWQASELDEGATQPQARGGCGLRLQPGPQLMSLKQAVEALAALQWWHGSKGPVNAVVGRRARINRSGAPKHIGAMVAVKDRTNALKNPFAHLHEADWTLEKALESPMLWDPIRFVETCPSSDGAMALVLMSEERADRRPGPKAWVHATSMRSEPTSVRGSRAGESAGG